MPRALVTGCAGFIGWHVTESLLADGWDVRGVDCFTDNYDGADKLANLETATAHGGFELVTADLAAVDSEPLLADRDVVFHLAAEPGVRSSWGQGFGRYLRNNIAATQRLLESAARHPDCRVVYVLVVGLRRVRGAADARGRDPASALPVRGEQARRRAAVPAVPRQPRGRRGRSAVLLGARPTSAS